MSLPRPGGYPGEKKSAGGNGGYSGGSASSSNVFAGYNPPSSNPNPYRSAGSGTLSEQGQGPGVLGFPMGGGYGSGGIGSGSSGGGGSGVFGNSGVSASGTTSGESLGAGGGVGPGMRGSSTGKWNQYGFSGPGLSSGASGIGDGGIGATGIGGSQVHMSYQQQLNWQWAPEGMNAEVIGPQMVNLGGSMAKSFISSNVAQYHPRVSGFWNTLKVYFAVDNGYVLKKMKALILPVVKKDWHRLPSGDEVKDDQGGPKFERPLQDVNAPDLYVPLMSFITFVLVTGYAKGAAAAKSEDGGRFSPEVLTEVTSACIVTHLLEVLVMRLGLYLINSPAVVLDLVAYTGYQYVGLCINMALGIALNKTAYYIALLWTGSMTSYFMFKTMAHTVPTGSSSREIMILGFGALQLLSMWWLGQASDLS